MEATENNKKIIQQWFFIHISPHPVPPLTQPEFYYPELFLIFTLETASADAVVVFYQLDGRATTKHTFNFPILSPKIFSLAAHQCSVVQFNYPTIFSARQSRSVDEEISRKRACPRVGVGEQKREKNHHHHRSSAVCAGCDIYIQACRRSLNILAFHQTVRFARRWKLALFSPLGVSCEKLKNREKKCFLVTKWIFLSRSLIPVERLRPMIDDCSEFEICWICGEEPKPMIIINFHQVERQKENSSNPENSKQHNFTIKHLTILIAISLRTRSDANWNYSITQSHKE